MKIALSFRYFPTVWVGFFYRNIYLILLPIVWMMNRKQLQNKLDITFKEPNIFIIFIKPLKKLSKYLYDRNVRYRLIC